MTAVATRPAATAAMKWWGWGDEGVAFTHDDKPSFGPFLQEHLGIDVDEDVGARRSPSTTSTSPSRS